MEQNEDPIRQEKLVRDRIPEIIQASGAIPRIRIADDREYGVLLRRKLQEEVDEFLQSSNPEELADVLEVLHALARLLGITEGELEQLRRAKAAARGGFWHRIVWQGSSPAPPGASSPGR